ncbi:toxin glutamine deamidase domain-containing protein [Streptomyces sp. NPDC016845]|uniref:toxin glutamine deamidase domain-containing protein n=1 Tax=Streptomyces sp. NPDC016845 TaxID=3364972 RepID=UPI0037891A2D
MRSPGLKGPAQRTTEWLGEVYGGLVELAAPRPVAETDTAWMMACRTIAQPRFPRTPMLAASVVVPKIGGYPHHPASYDPLADLLPVPPQEAALRVTGQSRRINARGCVAATHSAIDGHPSVAVPWQPAHEAPGWWARLHRRYFPHFDHVPVRDWDEVVRAVQEPGPDTRGVVWIRRAIGGHDVTGNLVYARNDRGRVVFLDGLTGSLARLDTQWVRELILIRALPDAPRAAEEGWRYRQHGNG